MRLGIGLRLGPGLRLGLGQRLGLWPRLGLGWEPGGLGLRRKAQVGAEAGARLGGCGWLWG